MYPPRHTLERIIYKIDFDLFFEQTADNFSLKLLTIKAEIVSALNNYPQKTSFTVLFASRESYYDFHLGKIVSTEGYISHEEIMLPNKSKIVFL